MAKLIQLADFKAERDVRAGFRPWRKFFNEAFNAQTRLEHLSFASLCYLAEPGELATNLFYDLILGFLGYDEGVRFEALKNTLQMHVIDIHLFLSDQIRFEMMRRLGWLSLLPVERYPIAAMILNFAEIKVFCQDQPPVLAAGHPQHGEYEKMVPRDRQVLIRRLLPSALEAYRTTHTPP